MRLQLTATIVTFKNELPVLFKTIESFLDTTLEVKLFIVDNSPTQELKKLCNNNRIEYIYSGSNNGFGFGHNLIIRQNDLLGKYHLILNPDIVIPPGTLEELYSYYEANPNIGILMPRILFPDKTIQYLPKILPSPINLLVRFVPILSLLFKIKANNYVLKNANYAEPFRISVASGCFMLVKADLFKENIFDERFFMYFEDFDLSRRIGENYELILHPNTHVFHDYGRGAHQSIILFKIFIFSLVKYFNKWGWFFDNYKKLKNREILNQFNEK